MKQLDFKSSALAGVAGGILLTLVVIMFDKLENNNPPLYETTDPSIWLLMGFIVGFSVQAAERLTGAS